MSEVKKIREPLGRGLLLVAIIEGLASAVTPALSQPRLVVVNVVNVNFDVSGDKKKKTGIEITITCPNAQPYAGHTLLPGSDDEKDFWRNPERHTLAVRLDVEQSLDNPTQNLGQCNMHIASGNPDKWHTKIQADGLLSDGSTRQVLPQTNILGFNKNNNDTGLSSYDFKFHY